MTPFAIVVLGLLYLLMVRIALNLTRKGTMNPWALRLLCLFWPLMLLVVIFFLTAETFEDYDGREEF